MTQLTAIVRDGKIVVVASTDLSDGTEVTLLIVRNGILQELDSTEDPQETQRILQAMEQFEATFPIDEGGEDHRSIIERSSFLWPSICKPKQKFTTWRLLKKFREKFYARLRKSMTFSDFILRGFCFLFWFL